MIIRKSLNQEESVAPYAVNLTITDLVRTNLRGLINSQQSNIAINNAFFQDYENWEQTGRSGKLWKLFHLIPGPSQSKRNIEEWSIARLAAELKVDVSVIRKIFEIKKGKGTNRISIDEVVEFALILNVTPGYLLQPLREHLERNVTYGFELIQPNRLKIKARDWLLWVHGISTADSSNSRSMESNLMSLTPEMKMNVSSKRKINPQDELERMGEAFYLSPVSAMIAAQPNPIHLNPLNTNPELIPLDANSEPKLLDTNSGPKVHPLDSFTRLKSSRDRHHARTRGAFAYMHHVRQAFRLMEKEHNPEFVKSDIEWCLERIREDLALIAVNLEVKEGTAK